MSQNYYQRARFLNSVADLRQLPPDHGYEVVFAGRSNAGKSSALNVLTQQTALAKVSKTPGRTQLINLFTLDESRRLVDLPGYGFAKVPPEVKKRWERNLIDYFETRHCLKGIILLMDIRHPLMPFDIQMLEWTEHLQLPTHILLTKADKFNRGPAMLVLQQVRNKLIKHETLSIQLFSAPAKLGLEELRKKLDTWYAL